MSLLIEGLGSAFLPCSLVLLIPGAAATIAGRSDAAWTFGGFAFGTLMLGWLRFSGRLGELSPYAAAAALALAAIALTVPTTARHSVKSIIGGLFAGAGAGILWEPCVGREFGALLNDLPATGAGGFGLFAVYTVGVLAPLVAVAAAVYLVPEKSIGVARPVMLGTGAGVLAVLALATAAGLSDDLVGRLVQLSLT